MIRQGIRYDKFGNIYRRDMPLFKSLSDHGHQSTFKLSDLVSKLTISHSTYKDNPSLVEILSGIVK